MLNTLWAVLREGKIEVLEDVDLREGRKVLVTALSDEESLLWQNTSQVSLNKM